MKSRLSHLSALCSLGKSGFCEPHVGNGAITLPRQNCEETRSNKRCPDGDFHIVGGRLWLLIQIPMIKPFRQWDKYEKACG